MEDLETIFYKGGLNFEWVGSYLATWIKGIVSDSNNIFLWHESEDINKKGNFQNKFQFQFYVYTWCMIMCIGTFP